jgi:hypothetical protein
MLLARERSVFYLKWAGIILVVLGLSLFAANEFYSRRVVWFPLSMPVSLTPGTVNSGEFWATPREPYDIELAVNARPSDPQRTRCLLGPLGNVCADAPSVVDLSWTISERGSVVASGDSNPPAGGNLEERLLGWFRPANKGPFVLHATVRKDSSALSEYHPHLDVILDLFERDGLAIGEAFGSLFALGIGGLGLIVLAVYGIALRRRRGEARISPQKAT